MLAGSFQEYDEHDIILFCSGVSNSSESSGVCFQREKNLIKQYSGSAKTFIYFSSSFVRLVEYEKIPYYLHKKNMELLVKANNINYLIVRLPQVVGFSKNKNTLTNYLFDKITNGLSFNIFKNSRRNLLDVDHVATVIHKYLFLEKDIRSTIHLENPISYTIVEIVHSFEKIIGKKALYSFVKGIHSDFEPMITKQCLDIFDQCGIQLGETYLHSLLSKYYSIK